MRQALYARAALLASTWINRPMSSSSTFRKLFETAAGTALPEWSVAEAAISVSTFGPGDTVFLQGEAHPFVHAVRSGLVKLVYLGEDGSEWIKSFPCEGRFFASVAALQPGARTSFMASAVETTVIERIDHTVLAGLAARHLAWSHALHTLTLTFAAAKEQRERELLTLDAQGRYLAFCTAQPALLSRIPQKDLARHLGVTPVGLNRIVMRVKRASASA